MLQPMGPLWNDFTGEVDEKTADDMDKNYVKPDEEMDMHAELLKSRSMDHLNPLTDSGITPCPVVIETGPTLKLARHFASNNIRYNNICSPVKGTDVFQKRNRQARLEIEFHDDADLGTSLNSLVLADDKVSQQFQEEILANHGTKVADVDHTELTEKEQYLEYLTQTLNSERKHFLSDEIGRCHAYRDAQLKHEDGFWNTMTVIPHGLLGEPDDLPEEQMTRAECIRKLIMALEEALTPGCIIRMFNQTKADNFAENVVGNFLDPNGSCDLPQIQSKLTEAWDRLHLPQAEREAFLINLCAILDKRKEFVKKSNITETAVKLWEKISKYVSEREALLRKIAELEITIIQLDASGDKNVARKLASRRPGYETQLSKITQRIEGPALKLQEMFKVTLTYKGENYLQRMHHDRSDLLYTIENTRTSLKMKRSDAPSQSASLLDTDSYKLEEMDISNAALDLFEFAITL
ncbi:hypothetical protein EG68_08327 [Paragonimus skrjabini miyazakii]|uniref:Uncharacterized protein n=1 Tax=Paragonimus skrjabini miyazakii TaxID=59628 RepID=A0A8S9YMF5_9TREM|nr:hypothetical protein EG68_08327 [Paragonimus skrjabini miyazakii]